MNARLRTTVLLCLLATACDMPTEVVQAPTTETAPSASWLPVDGAEVGGIAFTSDRDGNDEVYVADLDGGGLVRVTNHPGADREPAVSPDGRTIAFESDRSGAFGIWLARMSASGSPVLTQLTAGNDHEPSWGPDGRISFWSWRDGNAELYVMDADGSNVARINSHPSADVDPQWSPDGSQLAWGTNRDGNDEVYVMNADGTGVLNLSVHPGADREAHWSPNGSRLVWFSDRDGNWELYSANPDGTGLARLTDDPGIDDDADWSRDGDEILFRSTRSGNSDIHVMNADGTNVRRVTTNAAVDRAPSWGVPGAAVDPAQGYWPADGDALDALGFHDGTLVGNPTFAAGVTGLAFTLDGGEDGSADYVRVSNDPSLHVSQGDFTIQAWIKPYELAPESFVYKMGPDDGGTRGTNGWAMFLHPDGSIFFCLGGGVGINGCDPSAPTTVYASQVAVASTPGSVGLEGAWYHVVGVKADDGIRIYVNGVLAMTRPLAPFRDENLADLTIGAESFLGREPFHGQIDEVRLWNRALSPEEVAGQFHAPDDDGDGIGNTVDNCPFDANPTQSDNNGNGLGDACDPLNAATGRIVFASSRTGNSEIFIMDADGSNEQQLTFHGADDRDPVLSPDGQRIAFVTNRFDGSFDVAVMAADGSGVHPVVVAGQNWEPSWSPDGKRIAFTSNQAGGLLEVYVMNDDGSGVERLTFNGVHDQWPRWNPQPGKNELVFTRGGVPEDLYLIDLNTRVESRITTLSSRESYPEFSPDGSRVVFTSDRSGSDQIHDMPYGTWEAGVRQLTTVGSINQAAHYSPDGSFIVFGSNGFGGRLGIVTEDGDLAGALGSGPAFWPHWGQEPDAVAPIAGRIAFSSERGGSAGAADIYVMETVTGEVRRQTTLSSNDRQPALTPDGLRLAWSTTRYSNTQGVYDIVVRGVDAVGEPRRLSPDGNNQSPSWSPDGHTVIFSRQAPGAPWPVLVWVDTNDPALTIHELEPGSPTDAWVPRYSPDGSWIAFASTQAGHMDVYKIRSDGSGGRVRVTAHAGFDYNPDWAPDGSQIAFETNRWGAQEIATIPSDAVEDAGPATHRETFQVGFAQRPDYSPDGTRIAFMNSPSGNFEIWSITIANGSLTNLTSSAPFDGEPSWQHASPVLANSPPDAGADAYFVAEDDVLQVSAPGVLSDDVDVDGDPLTVGLVEAPTHGALSLDPTGSFQYIPEANFWGSDSFRYAASDGRGGEGQAIVTITVEARNDVPEPFITVSDGAEGSALTYDASSSFDVDGDPLTYAWDFGDGTSASGSVVTHAYADDGAYTVNAVVSDGILSAASLPAEVTITNVPPAVTDVTVTSGAESGDAVTLTATFVDPGVLDGPWGFTVDWGDGTTTTGSVEGPEQSISVTHSYLVPGTYVPTLVVVDDSGAGSEASSGDSGGVQVSLKTVSLDLGEDGAASPINLKSNGVIPVAILSAAGFDAADIDRSSLRFGPGGATPTHKALGHVQDVNGDGLLDLLSHYRAEEAGITAETESVCVVGATSSGIQFQGCSPIRVVGPRRNDDA